MRLKLCVAILCAAFAMAVVATPSDVAAQTTAQKKRAAAKKQAAKRYGPVPVSMAPPRARITVQPRSFLDPGREILPGSQHGFTDYAFPAGQSPSGVIDNRVGVHR